MPMTFGNDWTEKRESVLICLVNTIDSVCDNDYFINTSIKNQLDAIHACFSMIIVKEKKNNNSE